MSEIPQVLRSEVAFSGSVFDVRVDELRYEDESTSRCDVVEHAQTFGIIPLLSHDDVVLVRQYRHPVRRYLWEIPAGTAEPGEPAAEGAARELREETGYRAERLRAIGSLCMTPGFCTEIMHFFTAEGLTPGAQSLDEDERIDVAAMPLSRAWELVRKGEIWDVKTMIALLWMGGERGQLAASRVDRN